MVEIKELPPADLDFLITEVMNLYARRDVELLDGFRSNIANRAAKIRSLVTVPTPEGSFTLKDAFEQAWKPAATRSKNTEVEIGRYVDEFVALNGVLDLREYTRDHWAAWRADCLAKHGPGPTAFKRFSMMKTICNEAIRSGLGRLERKDFAGQDVTMRKLKGRQTPQRGMATGRTRRRGSVRPTSATSSRQAPGCGLLDRGDHRSDRCPTVRGHRYAGHRCVEANGMQTFYLARRNAARPRIPDGSSRSQSESSNLGFIRYIETRPKRARCSPGSTPRSCRSRLARVRVDMGLTRRGCDIHAFRHT